MVKAHTSKLPTTYQTEFFHDFGDTDEIADIKDWAVVKYFRGWIEISHVNLPFSMAAQGSRVFLHNVTVGRFAGTSRTTDDLDRTPSHADTVGVRRLEANKTKKSARRLSNHRAPDDPTILINAALL